MTKTRHELEDLIATLRQQAPDLVKDHPDAGDFWANFACASDFILDEAGGEDFEWTLRQVDRVLEKTASFQQPISLPRITRRHLRNSDSTMRSPRMSRRR